MNSRWNENLIISAMVLVSTHSDSWIKIGFLGPPKINFWLNLVKIFKILWEAQVWCKTMKNVVLLGFWPLVKPRADYRHFGHFSWKRHFGYSSAQTGCATLFWMFLRPRGEKIIFLDFSRFGMQIESRQNMVSTISPSFFKNTVYYSALS